MRVFGLVFEIVFTVLGLGAVAGAAPADPLGFFALSRIVSHGELMASAMSDEQLAAVSGASIQQENSAVILQNGPANFVRVVQLNNAQGDQQNSATVVVQRSSDGSAVMVVTQQGNSVTLIIRGISVENFLAPASIQALLRFARVSPLR